MKESIDNLQGSTIESVVKRISDKLLKRYGRDTALIVRDTCPLGLNWDLFVNEIIEKLKNKDSAYDKGIWIITDSKDKIYQVL